MLFLIFQLGKDRYAIEAERVLEVVPLVDLKSLPQAPKGIAGIFNLRGRPVPAVDLNELSFGTHSRERLTTRIIVVEYKDASGNARPLGLIAEQATQTLRKEPGDFVDSGLSLTAAPYLGPVLMDANGPIQLLLAQRLISEPMRELLFQQPPALANETH